MTMTATALLANLARLAQECPPEDATGIRQFLADGDAAALTAVAVVWCVKAGAPAELRTFIGERADRNAGFAAAGRTLAELAQADPGQRDPREWEKRGREWEADYERLKLRDGAYAGRCMDLARRCHALAREAARIRVVPLGGAGPTQATGANLLALAERREECIRAAETPPPGLFPADLRAHWKERADLLALAVSVFLGGAAPDGSGKTFCAGADLVQIRVRRGNAFAFRKRGGAWEKTGDDVFAVAGKLIGREGKADFPGQAAAVAALVRVARELIPGADFPEWHNAPAGGVRPASPAKSAPARPLRVYGNAGLIRALNPDAACKQGAAIGVALALAIPEKRNAPNRLAEMSRGKLLAGMTIAADSEPAARHGLRLLESSGLFDRLCAVRKWREWTDCVLALMSALSGKRRLARLRVSLAVWWNALQAGGERFGECGRREKHSVMALTKAAGSCRDTARRTLNALADAGALDRIRGDDRRCVGYRLRVVAVAGVASVIAGVEQAKTWTGKILRTAAAAGMPPPATAPPGSG